MGLDKTIGSRDSSRGGGAVGSDPPPGGRGYGNSPGGAGLSLTFDMTLKIKMKAIFIFNVLNLTLGRSLKDI